MLFILNLLEGFPSFLEGFERSADDATTDDTVTFVLVSDAGVDPGGLARLDDATEVDAAWAAPEAEGRDGEEGVLGDDQGLVVGGDALGLLEVDGEHGQEAGGGLEDEGPPPVGLGDGGIAHVAAGILLGVRGEELAGG